MGEHQTWHPQNQTLPVRKWCLHLGPERSQVPSIVVTDCLFRLGPSHIPQSTGQTAQPRLGPHGILAPHAEPGSCCPLVFHLTHTNAHLTAPGRVLSQKEGQDLPAKGLGIRAWPFCFITQRRLFSASHPGAFACLSAWLPIICSNKTLGKLAC